MLRKVFETERKRRREKDFQLGFHMFKMFESVREREKKKIIVRKCKGERKKERKKLVPFSLRISFSAAAFFAFCFPGLHCKNRVLE